MSSPGGRPVVAAILGAACISSSAIVMRLAGSSASMTALGRCGIALPVLALLAWLERRRGSSRLTRRGRWLARIAGVFLAADLIVWSHAIVDIGAGLGTVITNLQVVIVTLLAWTLLGERPRRSLLIALPVMLGGLALVGGLAGTGAYGAQPRLGAALGIGVAALYAVYILMLRQATTHHAPPDGHPAAGQAAAGQVAASRAPVVESLFQATLGATAGSAALGVALQDFRLGPAWPALGWLVLLALTSQVLGWLLITTSMPRLPAWLVSALLLVQPMGSLALSAAVLRERPTLPQLAGVALMLAGVLIAASGRGRETRQARDLAPAALE
ncbi:MAG: family transporter [Actinomycetia bacterium]|nr:family transporter [Actinomycetes bacterium]